MKKGVLLSLFLVFSACSAQPVLEDQPLEEPVQEEAARLVYPIDNFESGITLKSFGTTITPATSPVQPERFSGYHTGVDVEAGEIQGDVFVYSIAEGTVVAARTMDGYGGVMLVQYTFEDAPILALYGHLDPSSFTATVGETVTVGEALGILGEGYTDETDGERKHLHFALMPGETLNYLGYVQSEAALSGWLDPIVFFEERL